ncbi:MAG: Wzz/FepE/Etk N-terminal domain-containing protein [Pseudomonadota bacterium]
MISAQGNLPVTGSDQPEFAMPFPGDAEEASGGFTILQLWHMLRANMWLSAAIYLVIVAVAFVVIKKLPKSYDATAALIVNSDNADPLAGRMQGIGQAYGFFPTQVELINNSVVLRPVIDRLKLQADPRFNGGIVGDVKTVNDNVLANLRASINVHQGTGSQLLYISATSRDPVRAAEIANAVSDEYLRQTGQRTNAPAMERATRYAEQLSELKGKVDITQAKVAAFRERYGMADLTVGQGGNMEGAALADLQGNLLAAQNARRQLEGQQVTPEALALRTQLDTLESQLAQSLLKLGPRHPSILALQSQIDAAKRALAGNSAIQLTRARVLESKYQAEVAAERNRLLDRRNVQDQGAKLLLEQQLAQEAYAQALRGQDQVQFASVGNYKDITVVSRAEPPIKSSKPNKMKMFVAALAFGLALAVGGPFAYELFFNRRIRCRDDLERHFRIMTLAEFGPMNTASPA